MKWICPVCKKENGDIICSACRFDESENYEKYGVISKLGKKDKDNYEQAQQKKKKVENDIQLQKTEETLKEISKEVQIKIPIEKSDYVTKHELLKETCVATTRKTNSNIKKRKHKKLKLIAISTFVFIFAFIFMLTIFIGIFNKKNDNKDKEAISALRGKQTNENVLMSDNSKGSDTETVLGSNIKRNTIKTITFLNQFSRNPVSFS